MLNNNIIRDYKVPTLNQSTDDLSLMPRQRVRKMRVTINGENFSKYQFIRMVKAGRACQCGECIDCLALRMVERS